MECGMEFIKYLLFVFNLLFCISGVAILSVGAYILATETDVNHFTDNGLLGTSIVLIVAGSIIFIIAFLGCFGAIRKNYKVLIAFAILLFIIFIIEVAVGIAAAVFKGDFESQLKSALHSSKGNYSQSEVERVAWDKVQREFQCCGVDGVGDWSGQTIPYSCCHDDTSLVPSGEVVEYCVQGNRGRYLYPTGCYEKVKMKITSDTKALIGVGIGIAFVQILGIILALWLAHAVKKEEESGGEK